MALLTNGKVLTRLLQKHLQVQYIPEDSKHRFLILNKEFGIRKMDIIEAFNK